MSLGDGRASYERAMEGWFLGRLRLVEADGNRVVISIER